MLHSLGARGHIAAVGVATSSLEAARFCDAVEHFYAPGFGGGFGFARQSSPIGLLENAPKLPPSPMVEAPLALKKDDGSPRFTSTIQSVLDTADVRVLFRNVLAGIRDGQGIAIMAGPATDFAQTLALNGAAAPIAAKIRLLIVAAGSYAGGPPDPRIATDIDAARKLFAAWPGPIAAIGTEAGSVVAYPGSSIESDFTWAPAHPIVEAYRAFHAMPYDAPAPAVAAVLYAANPEAAWFHTSDPGTIQVLDDGRTKFTPSADGKHRVVTIDPAQKDAAIKAAIALATAKPAAPMGRRGG
jgi:hypothetical protein